MPLPANAEMVPPVIETSLELKSPTTAASEEVKVIVAVPPAPSTVLSLVIAIVG